MTKTVTMEALAQLLAGRPRVPRTIVAVAGAPGSGKSTVAEALVGALNGVSDGHAALVAMDGYHYDDALLARMGRLERKGAPDTFDLGGLRSTLVRLRSNEEDGVCVPVFDRAIEIARAGACMIGRSAGVVVVEGNYLLLQEMPWAQLAGLFDVTVMVDTPEAELRRRLTARWQDHGLAPDAVRRKVELNDLPNGAVVRDRSAQADYRLQT
ncbi:MAG: AAA family ATPase [Nannocystaceae bacterium]